MDTVQCREVIISTIKRRGKGIEHSPVRAITEVYEKDGTLIAEYDPMPETFTETDLLNFVRWVKSKDYDPEKMDKRAITKWLDSMEPDLDSMEPDKEL